MPCPASGCTTWAASPTSATCGCTNWSARCSTSGKPCAGVTQRSVPNWLPAAPAAACITVAASASGDSASRSRACASSADQTIETWLPGSGSIASTSPLAGSSSAISFSGAPRNHCQAVSWCGRSQAKLATTPSWRYLRVLTPIWHCWRSHERAPSAPIASAVRSLVPLSSVRVMPSGSRSHTLAVPSCQSTWCWKPSAVSSARSTWLDSMIHASCGTAAA
ncbi:hypothetical protein D9M69_302450 [compost metagenome]